MSQDHSISIKWFAGIHDVVGCRHWFFSHAEMVGTDCRSCFQSGEIFEISETDYRWGYWARSRGTVRGRVTTLREAVDAVEDRLTSLTGHDRMELVEARKAAGLPVAGDISGDEAAAA